MPVYKGYYSIIYILSVSIDNKYYFRYIYKYMNLESLVKKLEKSGLSNKEAIVYASLYSLGGGAYPSSIAKLDSLRSCRRSIPKV
jgi:hypothetical protein